MGADHVGLAWDVENAVVVPFVDRREVDHNYWETAAKEQAVWLWLKGVLESNTPKLGQSFGGYDALWLLAKAGIKVRNLLHDTRLLHHALYPELEKSLQFLAAAYTQQGPWKAMGYHGGRNVEKQDD